VDVSLVGMILGAIVGFAIGILFVEIIFSNNQSWPDVVPFVLAVLGALAGREAARRMRASQPGPS
jgi:hypothetical protein